MLHVGGASPYDVVVGTRPGRAAARSCWASRVQRVGVVFPDGLADLARPVLDVLADGVRGAGAAGAGRRAGQDGVGGGGLLGGARRGRLHPLRRDRDRRRRRDHRPGRLRGRDLAARGAGGARPDHAARDGRRRGRRQDRREHRRAARTWSAPSTSRPACCATWPCSGRCRARSWWPGSARSSSAASSPTRRSSTWSRAPTPRTLTADSAVLRELVERAIRVKVDVVVADLRETGGASGGPPRPRGAELRPHAWRTRSSGPRTTASGTARRSPWAASSSPSWPPGPGTLAPEVVERHHRTFARVGLPTRYDGARLRGAARRHAGGQEGPRLAAALRGARRAWPARGCWPGPPRPTCAPPTTRWREAPDDGRRRVADEVPGAQRPQPRPARPAPARDLRHHHARRARGGLRGLGPGAGARRGGPPDEPRGRAARLAERRRGRGRRRWC